jgi:hypothetical protein
MKSKNEVYDEYESCENSVWRDGTKKDKNFWFFNLYSVILVMLGLGAVVCSLIWSVMDKILDVIVAVSSVHANIFCAVMIGGVILCWVGWLCSTFVYDNNAEYFSGSYDEYEKFFTVGCLLQLSIGAIAGGSVLLAFGVGTHNANIAVLVLGIVSFVGTFLVAPSMIENWFGERDNDDYGI